jgi:Flp pilus assembly protein TadG
MSTTHGGLLTRLRSCRTADDGAVAVLVALLLPVLLGFAALAVDIARWYVEMERVQKAADAAALAGVVYMPQDFAQARTTALAVAAKNGYTPSADVSVTVEQGPRPSQLLVTVASEVPNAFGAIFGVGTTRLSRSATSDYAGPVPMGSPCNLFGNEPLGPSELTLGSSTNCTFGSTPNFWANIAGPETSKQNGDRYATEGCTSSSDSYCLGSGQTDNCDHFGATSCQGVSVVGKPVYYFKVRVAPGAGSVDLQIYDPAFVNVGDHCASNLSPASSSNPDWAGSNTVNPFVTDAKKRYAYGDATTSPASTGTFCTGDNSFGFDTAFTPTTTYALLAPNDSGDPAKSQPVGSCSPRQFRGFNGDLTRFLDASTAEGRSTDGTYVQRNFRQWISLGCSISAPATGFDDYFLAVRTNLNPGTISNTRMADPSADPNVKGSGHNRFAIRAVTSGNRGAVSVAAFERMPIYGNFRSGTSTRFYLARVPTAGQGNLLRVQFFDTGDSTDTGRISILAPSDNTGTLPLVCTDRGFLPSATLANTNLPGCTLTNVRSDTGYQGKVKQIDVRIPSDYACADTSPAGCWFLVSYAYGTTGSPGGVSDTTTWTASLEGDPVRLVK